MEQLLISFRSQLTDGFPELENIPNDLILLSLIKELPADTPTDILSIFRTKMNV